MCLGVPGKVLEIDGLVALVDFWGVRKQVRLDVVDEPVAVGDYVLNHVGYAIRRIPAEQVEVTLSLYEELLSSVRRRPHGRRRARRDRRGPPLGGGGADDAERVRCVSRPCSRACALGRPREGDGEDRPRPRLRDARLRQPRAGNRPLRTSRHVPPALDVIMGPGCPVCITDMPEVDEAVVLAQQGVRLATYGDMLRVPGTAMSLAEAQARGARVDVVYSVAQAVELARGTPRRDRLLRHRIRDHRGRDGRRAPRRPPAEFLGALRAQVHPAR